MRLRPSLMGRAVHCLYGFRDDVELEPDVPGQAALDGTAVHEAIKFELCGHDVEKMALKLSDGILRARPTKLFQVWKSWWPGHKASRPELKWFPEVAFSMTPEGVCEPVFDHLTEYPNDGKVYGRVDAIARSAKMVHIKDWKTGNEKVYANNPTMRFYGAMVARAGRAESAELAIHQITPEGVTTNEATMSKTDIDETIEDARAMLRLIPTSEPIGGRHCKYCRVKDCPERIAQ